MSLVLSAKVMWNLSQNEQFRPTLDNDNMFGPTFGLKNHSNFSTRNKITEKSCSPLGCYLPTHENFTSP